MEGVPTRIGSRREVLVVDPRPLVAQGFATAFDPATFRVLTLAPESVRDVPVGRGVAAVSLICVDVAGLVATLAARGRRVLVYGGGGRGVAEAVGAGAIGHVAEDADAASVRTAVDAVRRGDRWFPVPPPRLEPRPFDGFSLLTPREAAVLRGLLAGLRPADIAERDFVAVVTVRNQVQAVLTKLGVHSQLEAVALAHTAGWTADAA